MAVGEHIISAWPGSADRGAFDVYPPASGQTTPQVEWTSAELAEFDLYRRLRELRDSQGATEEALAELFKLALEQAPQAWLLYLEMLELAPVQAKLAGELQAVLENLAASDADRQLLIELGTRSIHIARRINGWKTNKVASEFDDIFDTIIDPVQHGLQLQCHNATDSLMSGE